MRRCAVEAGEILKKHFRGPLAVTIKSRGNPVTQADLDSEERVIAILLEEYPDHAILSEETNPDTRVEAGWTWIIDPLDGTRNYLSGIPFFCVNLALAGDGVVRLGITYNPLDDETFLAESGGGATVNGRGIHVSQTPTVLQSVVGADLGYKDERAQRMLETTMRLWPGFQSLRVTGSSALSLAYVAAGRLDVYVHHYLYPWDFAAGVLLVPEAGGVITDRGGAPVTLDTRTFIAGNPQVHADMLSLIRDLPWE